MFQEINYFEINSSNTFFYYFDFKARRGSSAFIFCSSFASTFRRRITLIVLFIYFKLDDDVRLLHSTFRFRIAFVVNFDLFLARRGRSAFASTFRRRNYGRWRNRT